MTKRWLELSLQNTGEKIELAFDYCPQCGEVPMMSYCCGEYFIFKGNNTCFCASFTEMHSSMKSEVEAWNKAVSNYEVSKRNDC